MAQSTATIYIETSIEVREVNVKSLKGLTGGWTKWGGAQHQLYQNQWEKDLGEWFCQNCGNKAPQQITPYMFEYPKDEYVRVCAPCFHIGCPKLAALVENPTD